MRGREPGGKLDAAALELLVSATGAWLEVASLRKQALKEGAAEAGAPEKFEAPAVQTVSSFSDPFAAHAPKHVVAAPAGGTGNGGRHGRSRICTFGDGSSSSGARDGCVCAHVAGRC